MMTINHLYNTTMNRRIIYTLLLLISSINIYSQEKENTSTDFEFLSGLTQATASDMETKEIKLDGESIPIYTIEGKRVRGHDLIKLMISGEYTFDFFVDENKDIKAVQLKLATEEEKEELLEGMQSSTPDSDFVGKKAAPFMATDLKGNEYNLDELEGKVIVLNFWFVECKPCVHEIPELNNIVSDYKGKDVVFIGFATNKAPKLTQFLEENTFDYNIVANCKPIARDYGVSAYPTHIIIDKESNVVYTTTGLGPTTIEDIRSKLNQILGE